MADGHGIFARAPEQAGILPSAEHPIISKFADYLESKGADKQLISRSDINPAEILPFLPHMMILDVVNKGGDFRARVFGTALVSLLGEERTGLLVSQYGERSTVAADYQKLRARWLSVFRLTYTEKQIVHFKTPTVSPDRSYMHYHGLFAPLTNGTAEVEQLIGIMVAVTATP